MGVGTGVGEGVGVGVGVGSVALLTTNLEFLLVERVSASIGPDVANGERSTVDVVRQYSTPVRAGCAGIVAE